MCIGYFSFYSCSGKFNQITFKDFNSIVDQSISFALENKCFNYSEYEAKNENKVFGLVVLPEDSIKYDTSLKFTNFDLSEFIADSKTENFSKDTFNFKTPGNHIVYPVFLIEVENDFVKYHRRFSKYHFITSNYSFIKTFLIRNPRVNYLKNNNLVLVEIDRIFESISERIFILISTDKSFKIKQIQCLERIKPYIPPPPENYR